MEFGLQSHAQTLDYLAKRLISPLQQLESKAKQVLQLQNRLVFSMQQQLQKHQQTFLQLKSSIEQLNPQAVLARGYAIVSQDQNVVTDSKQLEIGQNVRIQLHVGEASARITNKH